MRYVILFKEICLFSKKRKEHSFCPLKTVFPNKKRSTNSKPGKIRKMIVQIPKGVEDNLTQIQFRYGFRLITVQILAIL